ncbi:MAG: PAS domain-containing sensor histidine kinase [Acidobacteria bacterium]|nr:MAG: PAS domain-containing sensor histidine kinase [Acidobacteriota bacterium]
MRLLRSIGIVLAIIGLSLAAMCALFWIQPSREVTLLVYLPGIVIAEAVFGPWAGVGSVLLSVAASFYYRIWYLPLQSTQNIEPVRYVAVEELILLVVGLFLVWLMDQRTRSRRGLASGAQQLAAIMRNVSDAVLVFGRDFRVISMNAGAHVMLDRPGGTLLGDHADDLQRRFQFTPETPPVAPRPPNLAAATRTGITIHERGTITDLSRNRRIEVTIHVIPWRTAPNRIEGSVVVITDRTAVKNLQMRLVETARHAAVGQMFSGLSHDFNHVLDIVRRALAVLELHENAPPEERRRYREMIDRAAVDGSLLVRRLRDYMAGGTTRTQVNLTTIAAEVIELTRPLWRAHPALELVAALQPVPNVEAQRNDVQRVLVNLVFNAVEALGALPGRIVVHTEADMDHVRVWVEDNGPGIAPENLPRLFEAYYTTKPQGMGLGLFGAAQIARDHGGTLSVRSEPGKATRFTLELPLQASSEAGA